MLKYSSNIHVFGFVSYILEFMIFLFEFGKISVLHV